MAETGEDRTQNKPRKSASPNPERRNRLIQAAETLVMRYGFDKTTIDDISREAGVSKGAVYLHFASKDELMEELIFAQMWQYMGAFQDAMNADPMGGTVTGIFKHSLAALTDQPFMRALYNRDLHLLGDFLHRRKPALMQQRYLLNKEFIGTMQQLGLVRPEIDTEAIAHLLYLFRQGYLNAEPAAMGDNPPDTERTLSLMADLLGPYLTPDGLTDSQTGKDYLNNLIERYRSMLEDPGTPTEGKPEK